LPDGRAWNGIRTSSLINIVDNTRASTSVGTWESNLLRWASSRSASSNSDLEARWVDLNTRVGPSSVESNQLVADDVVSWGERSWELEVVWLVIDEVVGGPGSVGALALVGNLEPDLGGLWVVVGAVSWALGKVGSDWALVTVRGCLR
jgi:hypothetical protein